MRSPRCPLCDATLDGDDTVREHLASAHDLVDDPGTETRLDDVLSLYGLQAAGGTAGREGGGSSGSGFSLLDEPAVPRPSKHVYDPSADDERWRTITLGVGGILLVALAALALELAT